MNQVNALIGPAVVAAVIAGLISLVGVILNRSTTKRLHSEKLEFDREQAAYRAETEASLAKKKSDLERSLADWKRRTELAEQVLSDFYKARDIFASARIPFSSGDDGSTRHRQPGETENESRRRDAIYTPFERLTKHIDFFSELQARRYRFVALFGIATDAPFIALVQSYNRINHATSMLLSDSGGTLPVELQRKLEKDIGWTSSNDDPIKKEVEQAVTQIEAVCRPVLTIAPE